MLKKKKKVLDRMAGHRRLGSKWDAEVMRETAVIYLHCPPPPRESMWDADLLENPLGIPALARFDAIWQVA